MRPAALIIAIVGLTLWCAPAGAAPGNGSIGDITLTGTQVTGATVSATARSGSTVYLGGSFGGIGRRASGLARVTTAGGTAEAAPDLDPGPAGTGFAAALAAAPGGGVYAAGSFVGAGGARRPHLVRLSATGTVVAEFRPQISSPVASTSLIDDVEVAADGTVYIAGSFTAIGGQPRDGVAALDGVSGAVTPWRPRLGAGSAQPKVSQLELGASGVYVAGNFVTAGTGALPRRGVAQLSLGSGEPTAWNPDPNVAPTLLEATPAAVYLGGSFTRIAGQPRQFLAAVAPGGAGAPLAFDPKPDSLPTSLVARGGTVHVAGRFRTIGGQPRSSLAALDAETGAATGFNITISTGNVTLALSADGATLYLGLPFQSPDTRVGSVVRCGLAAVRAADGQPTPFDPQLRSSVGYCGGSPPTAVAYSVKLAVSGESLWTGAPFDAANVRPRVNAAAVDMAGGQILDWAPRIGTAGGGSPVRAMALSADASTVFVGGRFFEVNSTTRVNAAAVAAAGAADTPGAVRAFNPAPDDEVNAVALAPAGDRVYLGGAFTRLGGLAPQGLPVRRLGWVDPSTGAPSGWAPDPDAPVGALALAPDGRVFAGGGFAAAGAQSPQATRAGVAAFDPVTAQATGWNAALDPGANVASLALAGELVYVGGTFARTGAPGETARRGVAALDAATAALAPFGPALGDPAAVSEVGVAPDGTVYLFGSFATVNGAPRSSAASLTAGGAVTGWAPSGIVSVTAPIQFAGDRLLIGGPFTRAGSRGQAGFAIFGPAVAPRALEPPVVGGAMPEIGSQLRCAPGVWEGLPLISYTWLRDGEPVAGPSVAPDATLYRVSDADAGAELRCEETGLNAAGEVRQRSANAIFIALAPPTLVAAPVVAGEPWVGGVAACSTGLWRNRPTSYEYAWLLDGTPLAGRTGDTLPVTAGERGRELGCRVVARNASALNGGRSAAADSAPVPVTDPPPRNLSGPTVSGDPRAGADVTCEPGTWSGDPTFTFAWLLDGDPVAGATGPRFGLSSRELGRQIACRAIASSLNGRAIADSASVLVGPPARSLGSREAQDPEPEEPALPARRPTAATAAAARLRVQVQAQRGGTLLLRVRVPGAGQVDATARTAKRGRRAAFVVGRRRASARTPRMMTLRIRPARRGQVAIRRTGRRGLPVTVTVRFRPRAGGRTLSGSARLRLRQRPARAVGQR